MPVYLPMRSEPCRTRRVTCVDDVTLGFRSTLPKALIPPTRMFHIRNETGAHLKDSSERSFPEDSNPDPKNKEEMPPPLAITDTILLSSGHSIPQLGFGCYRSPPDVTGASVTTALNAGYRHIDTAQVYKNEQEVGDAVRRFCNTPEGGGGGGGGGNKVGRREVWVTTKLRDAPGRLGKKRVGNVGDLVAESVRKVAGEGEEGYVDLFLIHSPFAGPEGRAVQWKALEALKREGKVRALGVSNFGVRHLEELAGYAEEPITVNQIEVHPWCQQKEIVEYCRQHGIAIQAYSPLAQGTRRHDPVLTAIAQELDRTWAQVLIRWSLQHGFIPLPKSDTPERIASNAQVYDFALSSAQMGRLDGLDEREAGRVCWNPTGCP
ncbi:hypothetical protein NliqN6_6249 [Naganishia liquefaciens]|uniref:NADP-dependent oxidoreductase domain-containing protein n=1 Tax=Naganishia liquefaciens TaxID=104408 RepID=A0A8H3YJ62_9TREE|nr:hypothetical protein NliqN6_6249 [Naganishia liquefaciens]